MSSSGDHDSHTYKCHEVVPIFAGEVLIPRISARSLDAWKHLPWITNWINIAFQARLTRICPYGHNAANVKAGSKAPQMDWISQARSGFNLAQAGGKHQDAKALSGFGSAGVLEVVEDFRSDTYRAVYTVKFAGWVYVLHCFQKKSKSGIKTPKEDMDMINARLKAAKQDFENWQKQKGAR